ncbi:invasion associated locus B family protein [Pelagibacterium sediminicola]|uniref:invasion associated locus B family protein n=1 Tax=Pelagibacterium sediminicola TaxID=2248761 RepID=UPI000E30DFCB|nr:invasion associated locus B family protein [Pelagibacterium sediminicola]
MPSIKPGLAAIATLIFSISVSVAQETNLPGGATSLNETHGDWLVTCAAQENIVGCTVSQVQVNNQNRQRVLTVELRATERGNSAEGILVLPFGLALDNGVVLSIDQGTAMPALGFSTCLPAGCLVPLILDQAALTAMRAGTMLKAKAVANGNSQEVDFSISLSGFTSALARAVELGGP